jgi:hypothetical protein
LVPCIAEVLQIIIQDQQESSLGGVSDHCKVSTIIEYKNVWTNIHALKQI